MTGAESSKQGQVITEEPQVPLVCRFSILDPESRIVKSNGDLTSSPGPWDQFNWSVDTSGIIKMEQFAKPA